VLIVLSVSDVFSLLLGSDVSAYRA